MEYMFSIEYFNIILRQANELRGERMVARIVNFGRDVSGWLNKLGTYNILTYITIIITIIVIMYIFFIKAGPKKKSGRFGRSCYQPL